MTATKTFIGASDNGGDNWQGKIYEWDGTTMRTVAVTGRTFKSRQAAFDEACLLLATPSMPEDTMDDYYARNSE